MKRLSLQWRITLLTALLIAGTCICLNLLLYHSGAVSIDSLKGFVFEYTPESPEDPDGLAIEISDSQMSEFISRFSDEAYDVKTDFGRKGWLITVAVTIVSAAIAYFVSGQALKPLRKLSQQAEKIDQDSISDIRLNEDTVKEFRQLSISVNLMLDRLSESFATQRQFSGNAAHELRTPLAIMQTKLELFAAEHKNMEGDTAELVRSQAEQLDRLSRLVHTLLEMSNLSSAPRSDRIELAALVEEIITDLTPLASQNDITMEQDCDNVVITGSDALIYRLVFNLIENAVKYNRGAVLSAFLCIRRTAMWSSEFPIPAAGYRRSTGKAYFSLFSVWINQEAGRWAALDSGLRSFMKLRFFTAAPSAQSLEIKSVPCSL